MTQKERKFGSVSIPMGILKEVDKLIAELQYWPSRGGFIQDACLEKIREEWRRLRELRKAD